MLLSIIPSPCILLLIAIFPLVFIIYNYSSLTISLSLSFLLFVSTIVLCLISDCFITLFCQFFAPVPLSTYHGSRMNLLFTLMLFWLFAYIIDCFVLNCHPLTLYNRLIAHLLFLFMLNTFIIDCFLFSNTLTTITNTLTLFLLSPSLFILDIVRTLSSVL